MATIEYRYPMVNYEYLPPEFPDIMQIQYLAEKFLQFIPRGIPDYPSHGVDHSLNIIKHVDSMIKNWCVGLSSEEIYLLYCAAWLHDIGNIIERKNHNVFSACIINESLIIESLLGREMQNQLAWIAKAHSSSCNIYEVPIQVGNVRLRFISSLFRILDACEIINTKCPEAVYSVIEKVLNQTSKTYWESHKSILSIEFRSAEIIYYVTDRDKSDLLINHLDKEIESVKDIICSNGVDFPDITVIETTPVKNKVVVPKSRNKNSTF